MRCLYCITDLPVDGNTSTVTCPKCGSTFDIVHTGHRTILVEESQVLDFEQIERDIEALGIGPNG